MWWENAEEFIPDNSKLLSIILYLNATNVNILGKKNLHPILYQLAILKIRGIINQMLNNY